MLLAFAMNGGPIPREHGHPLRVIIPGHVGIRNVKWLNSVSLSAEEATGAWQRGMAYKGFPPSATSTDGIDVEKLWSVQEQPVQSVVLTPAEGGRLEAGAVNTVKVFLHIRIRTSV